VGATFERWDGKGIPGDLAAEAIPVPARIVSVARDVDIFYRLGGWPMASEVLQQRRGRAYAPDVAGAFLDQGAAWLRELDSLSAWESALEAEPEPHMHIGETKLDAVLGTFADFVDIKSPFTLGHSTGVADLASNAAQHAGLRSDEVRELCRAALVHDLGKAGVPNGIWDKPGLLSVSERERVRMHPYLTERILAPSAPLQSIALIAGSHHERLDGSGYYRGVHDEFLTRTSRILAAADVFQAMGEDRPYRPALAPDARATALQSEAAAFRLDRDAVRCVLAAAGEYVRPARTSWPSGLTDREVEVLRLISRGVSNRTVAERLVISPKTAGRHIENIYGKINVSSRASAALFALQNGLLRD
jgi:HD-GYP domain-containing protein (c-di-GMP phosphodiesterase class II)